MTQYQEPGKTCYLKCFTEHELTQHQDLEVEFLKIFPLILHVALSPTHQE